MDFHFIVQPCILSQYIETILEIRQYYFNGITIPLKWHRLAVVSATVCEQWFRELVLHVFSMNRVFSVAGPAEWLRSSDSCTATWLWQGRGWRGACTQRRGSCHSSQPCRTDTSSSPPLCSVTSNMLHVNSFCITTQSWPHPSCNKWNEIDTY